MNNNNNKKNNKVLKSKKPFFTTNKIAIIIVLGFVIVIGTALGILYGMGVLDSDSCDREKIEEEMKKNYQKYNYLYEIFEKDSKKMGCEGLKAAKQKLDELSDEQKVLMNDLIFFYIYKKFTTKKVKVKVKEHFRKHFENQDIFKNKWFKPTTPDNVKIYIQEFEEIKRMLDK